MRAETRSLAGASEEQGAEAPPLGQKEKHTRPRASLRSGIQYPAQRNLSAEKKQTHGHENRLVVAKEQGEWDGLGFGG